MEDADNPLATSGTMVELEDKRDPGAEELAEDEWADLPELPQKEDEMSEMEAVELTPLLEGNGPPTTVERVCITNPHDVALDIAGLFEEEALELQDQPAAFLRYIALAEQRLERKNTEVARLLDLLTRTQSEVDNLHHSVRRFEEINKHATRVHHVLLLLLHD